jgi:peptide/nickel transport system permease protein
MTRYLLRRVPSALLVLFLASIVVFLVIRMVPGDPVATLAGNDATPATRAAIRHSLGLDKSLWAQYWSWSGHMLTFRFGRSYIIGSDISSLLSAGFKNTAVLAGAALLIAVVLALVASIGNVLVDKAWLDHVLNGLNTLAVALPTFVTGTLLVLFLGVLWKVLPAGGTPPDGFASRPDLAVQYLVMPAICLGLPVGAALTRFLTEALRTQLDQPYVMTARALGIPRRRIVLTQALRNALPTTVAVVGVQIGALLGGAVLVEAIFSWPGLGQLIEQAISSRDYPLVQVLLLLSVFVFVVTQLFTDVVNAWLDPRIRLGGAE